MREYIDIFNRIVDKLSNAHAGRHILFTFHHNDSFNINNDETTITIAVNKHNLDSSVMTTIFQQQAVFSGPLPQVTNRLGVETFWRQALAELGFRGVLHIDAINTFRNEQETENRSGETGQNINGSNSDTSIQEIQGSPTGRTMDGGRV